MPGDGSTEDRKLRGKEYVTRLAATREEESEASAKANPVLPPLNWGRVNRTLS